MRNFLKTFFIDYLPEIVFIDNDETTQATRISFLKRSLKTEAGGGDLLKYIVDSRGHALKKFAKKLQNTHWIPLKYSVKIEVNLPDTNCEFMNKVHKKVLTETFYIFVYILLCVTFMEAKMLREFIKIQKYLLLDD